MTYCSSCMPTDAKYFTNGKVSTASRSVLKASSPIDAVPRVPDPFPPLIIWLKGVYSRSRCESELDDGVSGGGSGLSDEGRVPYGTPGGEAGDAPPPG